MPGTPYAWLGDVETFLGTPEDALLQALTAFAKETGSPQLFAWDRSLQALRTELAACMPEAAGFALILEFELPRTGGRRPDLIVLENGIVIVVEFKNRVEIESADVDQIKGYVRDLEDYHVGCRGRRLIPVLVPIGMVRESFERDGVRVVPTRGLGALVRQLAHGGGPRRGDARAWAEAVGLQVAHTSDLGGSAVFLSGNGPLVQVLQYSLDSKVFVQDMRSFLRHHGGGDSALPAERIVVFDEAQRAWDRDRVLEKHRGRLAGSEPDLLIRIGDRVTDGFALIALIGEGQEIHAGEESGIRQWVEAVGQRGTWQVVGPPQFAHVFRGAGIRYREEPLLGLTSSLRSHRASDVALWAGLLLDGRIDQARTVALGLHAEGFVMRASRNLADLRQYVLDRYADEPAKRFGLIVSSKFRKLAEWGLRSVRHPYWYYGQWFEAPRTDSRSGANFRARCNLHGPARRRL